MIEVHGKYCNAKIFTNNVEDTAMSQISELCNQEFSEGSNIRIMPDCHAGAGCVIGTTMKIKDKVVPNLVGVDIGCGMTVLKLGNISLSMEDVDSVIHEHIPSGFSVRNKPHQYAYEIPFDQLKCKEFVNIDRAKLSIGTLGGGNHFIEINKDNEENIYLVIHSGSRNLGKQVAEYYQNAGYLELLDKNNKRNEIIEKCKAEGKEKDIEKLLNEATVYKFQKQLAWVEGQLFEDYINDIKIVQKFATFNRQAIMMEILDGLGIYSYRGEFQTIHNYIDTDNMLLRKGSVSAQYGERLIIPINMRDGSLICTGKGNEDWNYSAPHGAGRLMSRSKAKEMVSMEEYKNSMEGIYTTSVNQSTLDECPMAYKPMQEIIDNISDTVKIEKVIKPIYNFKAGE